MPLYRAELRRRKGPLPPVLIHDPSQVLYLPFDKDDGSYARDRSGHNNHGTINGASPAAGKVASGLSFDGVDDYVDVPSPVNGLPTGNASRSITAWIKVDDYDNHNKIVSWGRKVLREASMFWVLVTSGRLAFGLWADDHLSTQVVPTGEWHFVAATLTGRESKQYYDGDLVSTYTHVGEPNTYNSAVKIGHRFDLAEGMAFDGISDEVRLFNRALSQAEIQRIMNMRGLG